MRPTEDKVQGWLSTRINRPSFQAKGGGEEGGWGGVPMSHAIIRNGDVALLNL